jgi:hypothetical protein
MRLVEQWREDGATDYMIFSEIARRRPADRTVPHLAFFKSAISSAISAEKNLQPPCKKRRSFLSLQWRGWLIEVSRSAAQNQATPVPDWLRDGAPAAIFSQLDQQRASTTVHGS